MLTFDKDININMLTFDKNINILLYLIKISAYANIRRCHKHLMNIV